MTARRHGSVWSTATLPDPDEATALMSDDEDPSDGDAAPDIDDSDSILDKDEDSSESTDSDDALGGRRSRWKRWAVPQQVLFAGLAMVIGLAALAWWQGIGAYQSRHAAAQEAQFVQVASQGAVNLTTIDWEHADADVQRILDSASGQFYDDFANRSQPFIEVVKQTRSKSVGTLTQAGLESVSGDEAQVLVAVNVKTTQPNVPEQGPRSWRTRISVQKVGDEMKVSNVEFVP